MILKVTYFKDATNFGDTLTPKILNYFNIKYEYSDKLEFISTGSVARHAESHTTVLGSGIMNSNEKLVPDACWKFVRGPYTRNRVLAAGGDCPAIYGDPGLLISLMCDESKKEYDIGILPHVADYDYVINEYKNYHVINLTTTDPFETVKEITKCRSIISSSLHGIICAHSYGIPAAWVRFGNRLKGDGIKFEDYYSSVGLSAELSTVSDPIFTIGKLNIDPIINIFNELKDIYK